MGVAALQGMNLELPIISDTVKDRGGVTEFDLGLLTEEDIDKYTTEIAIQIYKKWELRSAACREARKNGLKTL
jgi:hypothetical protein